MDKQLRTGCEATGFLGTHLSAPELVKPRAWLYVETSMFDPGQQDPLPTLLRKCSSQTAREMRKKAQKRQKVQLRIDNGLAPLSHNGYLVPHDHVRGVYDSW